MARPFKKKNRGDKLTARHINNLSHATRAATTGAGAYAHTINTGTSLTTANAPTHIQRTMEVVGQTSVSGIYFVHDVYYDHSAAKWRVSEHKAGPYRMDANAINAVFLGGDRVLCYWDYQRNMYLPMGPVVDKMWCAEICECAIEDDEDLCCVYRGRVKRIDVDSLSQLGSFCEPKATILPAFIISEKPLPAQSEGWVRHVLSGVSITWTSDQDGEITESLDLFEWCAWPDPGCPSENGTIIATLSHTDPDANEVLKGIGDVTLKYQKEVIGPPVNDGLCTLTDKETWAGEFKCVVSTEVRLFPCSYKLTNSDVLLDGYVRPDWLTGEFAELYYEDQEGFWREDRDFQRDTVTPIPGSCLPLTDGSSEAFVYEDITRYYRIRVDCEDGLIGADACVQHLYPIGHPVYGPQDSGNDYSNPSEPYEDLSGMYYIADADTIINRKQICTASFIGDKDLLFGDAHTGDAPLTFDGVESWDRWFQGTQFTNHTFCNLFAKINDLSQCDLFDDPRLENRPVRIHFTWK